MKSVYNKDAVRKASKRKMVNASGSPISCDLLGMPKVLPLPPVSALAPADSVSFFGPEGFSFEYLLCVHIEENPWFCHRGSFNGSFLKRTTLPIKRLMHQRSPERFYFKLTGTPNSNEVWCKIWASAS